MRWTLCMAVALLALAGCEDEEADAPDGAVGPTEDASAVDDTGAPDPGSTGDVALPGDTAPGDAMVVFLPSPLAQACQSAAEAVEAMHEGLESAPGFDYSSGQMLPDAWDAMEYFDALPHLGFEAGYLLDWVYEYHYDMDEGAPDLYARLADVPPFATYADYLSGHTDDHAVGPHITIDGTPEGFVERMIFNVLRGQFLQKWHYITDHRVFCTHDAVAALVAEGPGYGMGESYPADFQEAALAADPQPTVDIGESEVTVSLVWFTEWGGLSRKTYTYTRDFPHELLASESEVLAEYECGVVF